MLFETSSNNFPAKLMAFSLNPETIWGSFESSLIAYPWTILSGQKLRLISGPNSLLTWLQIPGKQNFLLLSIDLC